MNQVKKIKRMLTQWEQEKKEQSVDIPKEEMTKVKSFPNKTCMEKFLESQYNFRFNVLMGETEFHILGERERNSIFLELRGKEIKCTYGGLLRFIHSSMIEEFHPFYNYFQNLLAWDGKDRMMDLAKRVSNTPLWLKTFHRWMLPLTAQWMEMEKLHANSMAPILVSTEQGMMKSTF